MTWRTREVRSTDGTRILYREAGEGRPLVIVHGGANTARDYYALARELDGFRIALIERRNYGHSGAGPAPHDFSQDGADVAAVINDFSGRADLFGHSAGALVALHVARDRPGCVGRLALYEPPLSAAGPGLDPVLSEQRRLVRAGDPLAALVLGYTRVLGMDPDVARHRLSLKTSDLDALAAQTLNDVEAWARLSPDPAAWRDISQSTLLLRGEESIEHPLRDSVAQLADILARARLVELPGQDHIAHIVAPAQLAAALQGFLEP